LPENLLNNEGYLSIKALSETFEVFLHRLLNMPKWRLDGRTFSALQPGIYYND
jgi:hypothetical protein